MLYFYHGTSLEQAKKLMTIDLGPMAVPAARALDWREYTDFGKGFYTTTNQVQAERRARQEAKQLGDVPAVIAF